MVGANHNLMSNARTVGLTLVYLFVLTGLDILVVEGYYRQTGTWDTILMWHLPFWWIGCISLPIILAFVVRSIIPLWITVAVLLFGVEDTLFYAVQFHLPDKYVGVGILGIWEPSLFIGVMLTSIGLSLLPYFVLTQGILESRLRQRYIEQ